MKTTSTRPYPTMCKEQWIIQHVLIAIIGHGYTCTEIQSDLLLDL